MGISAIEILEMIQDLKNSIIYWEHCQPSLVPKDLMNSVRELEDKLQKIVDAQ